MISPRAKMKGSQQKGSRLKGLTKNKTFKSEWQFGYVAYKTNEYLYHVPITDTLNVISRRIKGISGDVIIEGT